MKGTWMCDICRGCGTWSLARYEPIRVLSLKVKRLHHKLKPSCRGKAYVLDAQLHDRAMEAAAGS